MKIIPTSLNDAFIIQLEKFEDKRGFFARSWDSQIFEKSDLEFNLVQCNISFNKIKGTIRGLHYQDQPFEETKLVRCTHGKIFDVIIDLRKSSKTYLQWGGFELSDKNYHQLYVPKGFAHGFQTLEPNVDVFYQVSQFHTPQKEKGIKWNDSTFNIDWPLEVSMISKKDSSWPLFASKNK